MKSRILIFISFICAAVAYGAPSLPAEAEAAYRKSDFQKAEALYLEYLKSSGADPSAADYFNLGNAAVKNGNYGIAVLSYQRAKRLDPTSDQIRNNLAYVESKVEDRNMISAKGTKADPHPETPSFFSSVYNAVALNVSPNLWGWLALVCFALTIGGVAAYFFSSAVLVRKIGFFGAGATLAGAVLFLIFAFMGAAVRNDHTRCVIIENKIRLAPEAGAESSNEPELNQGTVVTILSTEENAAGKAEWFKVRLNSDYLGWVKASDVEII